MSVNNNHSDKLNEAQPTHKKVWEEPAILVERSLVVEAQDGFDDPDPFMGGLLGSGGAG